MRRTLGNAIVHVFDPTLKYGGVGDVHHDVAITPEKGNVTLRKTTRHGVYSYVTQPGKGYDAAVSGIPLREAVKMVGGRVAVLRLDVGGLEMLLIDEWSRRGGLDIPQVVVRFHDGPFWWRGGDRQFVTRAVQKMVGMGYDALDRVGSEYTFIRGEYNMNDDLGVGEDEDDEEENDTDEHRGHDGDEGDNDEGL